MPHPDQLLTLGEYKRLWEDARDKVAKLCTAREKYLKEQSHYLAAFESRVAAEVQLAAGRTRALKIKIAAFQTAFGDDIFERTDFVRFPDLGKAALAIHRYHLCDPGGMVKRLREAATAINAVNRMFTKK